MADVHGQIFDRAFIAEMRIRPPAHGNSIVNVSVMYDKDGGTPITGEHMAILDDNEWSDFADALHSYSAAEAFLLRKLGIPVDDPTKIEPRQADKRIIGLGG